MSSIEEGFTTYLGGHAGLSNLIGDRIYPIRLPEKAIIPAVTYQRISGPRLRSHSGPSGVAHPRYQFNCWGSTYPEAKAVGTQLRFALDCYQGMMGDVKVQVSFVEDDRDGEDIGTKQFRDIVDVIIWHVEATA